jgi:hypothetical protein
MAHTFCDVIDTDAMVGMIGASDMPEQRAAEAAE